MEVHSPTPYELRVMKNIEENQSVLRSLGFLKPVIHSEKITKTVRRSNGLAKRRSTFKTDHESPTNSYIPARRTRRSSSVLKAQGYDDFEEVAIADNIEEDTPLHKRRKVVTEPTFGPIQGVSVGTWWQTRMECSAAGVHRPTVAGIHGKQGEGCYSLALSGGYEDDIDYGDFFTYTGCGGRDLKGTKSNPKNLRTAPQTKDQVLEGPNAALASNIESKLPVRVIRGYKLQSPYAPEEGYRYDGLYSVERCWIAMGLSGYKVCKFALKRLPDQDPPPWKSPEHMAENGSNSESYNGFNESEILTNFSEENESLNENTKSTRHSKLFSSNFLNAHQNVVNGKENIIEKHSQINLKIIRSKSNLKSSPDLIDKESKLSTGVKSSNKTNESNNKMREDNVVEENNGYEYKSLEISNGLEINNISHVQSSKTIQSKVSPANKQLKSMKCNDIETEVHNKDTINTKKPHDVARWEMERTPSRNVNCTGSLLNSMQTGETKSKATVKTPNSIEKRVRFSPEVLCADVKGKTTSQRILFLDSENKCNKFNQSYNIEKCSFENPAVNPEEINKKEPEASSCRSVTDDKKQATILNPGETISTSVHSTSVRSNRYSLSSRIKYYLSPGSSNLKTDEIPVNSGLTIKNRNVVFKDLEEKNSISSTSFTQSLPNKRKQSKPVKNELEDSCAFEKCSTSQEDKKLKKDKPSSNKSSPVKPCNVVVTNLADLKIASADKVCFVDATLESPFLGWDWDSGESEFLGFDLGDDGNILNEPQRAEISLFYGWNPEERLQALKNIKIMKTVIEKF